MCNKMLMLKNLFVCSGSIMLLALVGCNKRVTTEAPASPKPTQTRTVVQTNYDGCDLLTKEDIQQIQGSPVTETKGTGHADGHLRVGQCYYATEESNRSVSLMVTQNDPSSTEKQAVKEAWAQSFGRQKEEKKEESEEDKEKKESLREQKRRGGEEEGREVPLKKVEAVGEEAYWVGSRVGGALYVLKKDAYLRISIGGPDSEEDKINKTKALAQKALDRL